MVINFCDKHNPTSIQNGLSKYVTQYIIDDLPVNPNDLVYIDFYKNDKFFYNVVFTKDSFLKEKLKKRYYFEIDFHNEELENMFFKKHMKSYCALCVKEYEEKHNIDLVSKLKKPSFFEFD